MDEVERRALKALEKMKYIDDSLDDIAKLAAVAEEAAEVSQAALKVLRAYGGVFNPTPVTEEEAAKKLDEELKDLFIVLLVSGFDIIEMVKDATMEEHKLDRWVERIKEAKNAERS